jgi:FlaA1/EpsC-like NDP-sugar epimerase
MVILMNVAQNRLVISVPVRVSLRVALNILFDGLLAALAVACSFWLANPAQPLPRPMGLPLAGAAAIWLIGVPFGLSRLHWRFISLRDLAMIAAAAAVTGVMLSLLLVGAGLSLASPAFPVILVLVLVLYLTAPKLAYRLWRQAGAEREETGETAILIGDGQSAELFLAAHARAARPGYRITGLMALSARHVGRRVHGLNIFGAADAPERAIARLAARPDFAIIAHEGLQGAALTRLIAAFEAAGIRTLRAPSLTRLTPAAQKIELTPIAIEDLLNRAQVPLDRDGTAVLIAGRRVMVTGAGGSIGAELARQVAGLKPAELLILDHGEFALWQIDLELGETAPAVPRRAVIADVRDGARLAAICEDFKPELVFHAAALKHVPIVEANRLEGLRTNVLGTRAVADAAAASGARLMVLISTDKAVNPSSVMGASKRLAEIYAQALDVEARAGRAAMRCVTVRFGNVLGSTGSVVPLFRRQLAAGGPLTITHPDMQRYFMTVREAVGLVLQASVVGSVGGTPRGDSDAGTPRDDSYAGTPRDDGFAGAIPQGGIFVLDMGEPVKIVDLARQMIRLAGLRPEEDIRINFTGLRPGEKLFEELFHGAERPEPTGFAGLLMATPRVTPLALVTAALDTLAAAAARADTPAAMDVLIALVPEFAAPATLALHPGSG